MCATLRHSCQGVKVVSNQLLLRYAKSNYRHLTLRVLFELCMFREINIDQEIDASTYLWGKNSQN